MPIIENVSNELNEQKTTYQRTCSLSFSLGEKFKEKVNIVLFYSLLPKRFFITIKMIPPIRPIYPSEVSVICKGSDS